ncbi:MAG: 16S rRNA (adenine(1518)-N(6)/adenine(1519)-N(6))-dimethyltransferase RsmA [Gemmatimonadales bacterium]
MPRPKRSLSQNFLSDPRILARIADAVGAGPEDTVLEIGPGPGGLTHELLQRAGRVVAIEKDRELAALLTADPTVGPSVSFELHEGDALELDWSALAGPDAIVCGNIPYHITTPLIDKALQPPRARRVVFLMQKEVADRIVAPAGGEDYGALSIGVQAVAQVERLFIVARGSFHPAPKVDSAVVRFTPLAHPLVEDREVADFRRFTVGMFSYRRKQLVRGIRELTGLSAEVAASAIGQALESMPGDGPSFSVDSRPEQVPPLGFVLLCRAVISAGWRPE